MSLKTTVTTLLSHGLISPLSPACCSLAAAGNKPSAKYRSWPLLSLARWGLCPQMRWQPLL